MSNLGNNPRRLQSAASFASKVFDDTLSTFTTTSFRCLPFNEFLLLIKFVVTATPTDILFIVEFSADNVTFHKYMNGPFGDLRYEDSAGNKNEAISGKCLGRYVRVTVTATGTTAANKFTVDINLLISN